VINHFKFTAAEINSDIVPAPPMEWIAFVAIDADGKPQPVKRDE